MAHPKVVYPEKVMPFVIPECEGKYVSRMLIDKENCGSEKMQVNHGVVKAGKDLSLAIHEGHDELYVILKGNALLHLDGETYELRPGTVVFIPADTPHGILNGNESEPLELITIWAGTPAPGVNPLYDKRKEQWGTTYLEIDKELERMEL